MNKLLVISSALLLSVAAVMASPASARDDPREQGRSQSDRGDHRGDSDHHDRNHGNDHDRHDRHSRNDRYRDNRDNRNRHENRRYWANHRYHAASRYLAPRGYRYNRWTVGARLPYGYYGRNYYINYHSYGLAPPPRGYMWVRVAGDVYLVSIRNGQVRDIRLNLFF